MIRLASGLIKKDQARRNGLIIEAHCKKYAKSANSLVVGNAIPKSGTYLLNAIFRELGRWGDPRLHLLDNSTQLANDTSDTIVLSIPAVESFGCLPTGIVAAAHLHYSPELSAKFQDEHVRHIFQYRDFRDVFLSYAAFYAYNDAAGHWSRPRHEQAFFREFFSSHRDRISYAICKMMESFRLEDYAGWLDDRNTLTVRFEEMYSELSEGDPDTFGINIQRLLKFLDVDPSDLDAAEFKKRVLGGSRTKSSDKNKISRYRSEYEPEHYRLLDNERFRKLNERFGISE